MVIDKIARAKINYRTRNAVQLFGTCLLRLEFTIDGQSVCTLLHTHR